MCWKRNLIILLAGALLILVAACTLGPDEVSRYYKLVRFVTSGYRETAEMQVDGGSIEDLDSEPTAAVVSFRPGMTSEERAAVQRRAEIEQCQKWYRQGHLRSLQNAESSLAMELRVTPTILREDVMTPEFEALLAQDRARAEAGVNAEIDFLTGRSDSSPSEEDAVWLHPPRMSPAQRAELMRRIPPVADAARAWKQPEKDPNIEWIEAHPGEELREYVVPCSPEQFLEGSMGFLAEEGSAEGRAFLRSLVQGTDPLLARHAARTLCQYGDPEGIRAVAALVESEPSAADRSSLLGDLEDAQMSVSGMRGTPVEDDGTLKQALRGLAQQMVSAKDPYDRASWVRAVDWSDEAQRRVLYELFEGERDTQVVTAIGIRLHMASEWPADASAFVLSKAVDPDAEKRRSILPGLEALARSDAQAENRLRQMASSDPDPEVRARAEEGLEYLSQAR